MFRKSYQTLDIIQTVNYPPNHLQQSRKSLNVHLQEKGLKVDGQCMADLRFAEDVAVATKSIENMCNVFNIHIMLF